jgi:hypothetical protein
MHFFFAKPLALGEKWNRRKIRLIESNANCRHLTKLTSGGTLWQVFFRVYGLEIANFLHTFSHVCIFNPALSLYSPHGCPSPSLLFNSPPPFPVGI